MTDYVTHLIDAIDRKDPEGIRAAYATDARLVAMTPNTFQVHDGADAVTAKMAEWFTTWEEDPGYSFLGTVRNGDHVVVEFERTSIFEGEPWVVRQANVLRVGSQGISEHRMYCCGPRAGEPELATAFGGAS